MIRGSATSAHVVPAGDMLDGDVQLVGYMFDDPTSQATPVILSRVLFDVTGATAVPPVPYPVPVTELQQIREGMTFTTASTYNEWEVVEYLQDDNCISPSPRCEHSWTWKKTRGWPGSVSGTAELRYPDVSAIPGYSGGERPIPTSYSASVVIQLDLCDREDSMIACAPRAFARVKP